VLSVPLALSLARGKFSVARAGDDQSAVGGLDHIVTVIRAAEIDSGRAADPERRVDRAIGV
jgi:hypothetical protein